MGAAERRAHENALFSRFARWNVGIHEAGPTAYRVKARAMAASEPREEALRLPASTDRLIWPRSCRICELPPKC